MSIKPIKLLVNFGPLKIGGGHNVALNFILELKRNTRKDFEFYFVVCEGSGIKSVLEESQWSDNLIVVSRNPLKRIFEELTSVSSFVSKNKISAVFTYFGFAIFSRHVKQIIGSADSNLYFPEIKFWNEDKIFNKIKRKLIDHYRIFGIKSAAGVIYENKSMFDRSTKLFGVRAKKLIYPSINVASTTRELNLDKNKSEVRLLFLCSWQRNKNIMLVPAILREFLNRGVNSIAIISTNPDGSALSRDFLSEAARLDVISNIRFVGGVDKDQLADLYDKIDLVFLLSKLESFSNNIIEAWFYKKPLIVSDEEWSRSICYDAACYVDRNQPELIVDKSIQYVLDENLSNRLIGKGTDMLKVFPSINTRFEQELDFIKEVVGK